MKLSPSLICFHWACCNAFWDCLLHREKLVKLCIRCR